MLERARLQLKPQSDGNGDREYDHVATVPVDIRQHRDARGYDHAEHDNHAAAQHLDRYR